VDRERELELRLEQYEVTAVPAATQLRLVWSAPADGDALEVEQEGDRDDDTGTVALLSAYRITRVPSRAAG
jgi:hypothetical protein